jgi:acetyltransferase
METPPSIPGRFTPDAAAARAVIDGALEETREWLTEPESKAVLAAYGIPTVATSVVAEPREAAARAAEIGAPVALKVVSPDITHKSDIGGVALDLATPQAVHQAAEAMAKRIAEARPAARLEGFSVQPMVRRYGAYELIVGVVDDALFGPVILFGQGGTAVEVVGDTALGLPPLNMKLARDLMARTRIFKQLQGYRARPAAAIDAVALTLVKVSQLIVDAAEVAELDINPLLTDEYGVVALDARIRVAPVAPGIEGARRFAIRPYPSELQEKITLADGTVLLLRPVRPEDEPGFHEGFKRLTPRDIRMRFFASMKTLPHTLAARLTQIDYDREMALIAVTLGPDEREPVGGGEVLGVVRIAADPDNRRAEYAVIVRSDVQQRGLGRILMDRIIAYARRRGIGEIFGHVLEENTGMLEMCRHLGFSLTAVPDEPGLVRVTLPLEADNAARSEAGE